MGERERSILEVSVDDIIEDRADDDDDDMLGKLALCEDAVKELSAGGKFKRGVVICARLEALVKLDLKG